MSRIRNVAAAMMAVAAAATMAAAAPAANAAPKPKCVATDCYIDGSAPKGTVRVTVVDQFGTPLPGINLEVAVMNSPTRQGYVRGFTNANGQVSGTVYSGHDMIRIWSLPAGFAEGMPGAFTFWVNVTTGKLAATRIVLPMADESGLPGKQTLTGKLLDQNGQPAAGQVLKFYHLNSAKQAPSAVTAADGTFTFRSVLPGTGEIEISNPKNGVGFSNPTTNSNSFAVTVSASQPVTTRNLAATRIYFGCAPDAPPACSAGQ